MGYHRFNRQSRSKEELFTLFNHFCFRYDPTCSHPCTVFKCTICKSACYKCNIYRQNEDISYRGYWFELHLEYLLFDYFLLLHQAYYKCQKNRYDL